MLPHARRGAIAGLLEVLNDRGGKEDLFRIAEELRLEVDDLLPIVEAAVLLDFAKSERGDVELTPAGKAFAEADIETRKILVPPGRAGPYHAAAADAQRARE